MSTGFNHSVIKNASIILRNYFMSAWQSTHHCEIMVNKLVSHTMKTWVSRWVTFQSQVLLNFITCNF